MGKKQLNGHFKQQTSEISHEQTWTWLRKENLKKETESLLIAAQNNTIRTNYVKARIEKKQQNSRCRFCGDRDEAINCIINEWSKLATKDWVGKEVHWELCKFKFDHMNKWNMYNPESIKENEMHKILRDFEIQMTPLISTRQWDLVIVNKKKKTCQIVDFAVPADHRFNLKKTKREISTNTLLENWKNNGTWKCW